MTTTIELATVPSADTPGTCLYVHHDKHSYLFGHVPEGTQRALNSRKIRFGGTEHVFLSGPVGWDQMGGLMGYLLSIGAAIESAEASAADMNDLRREAGRKLVEKMQHSGVCVHGGDNICHMLAACRPVIMRQAVRVRACELRADPRAAAPAADDATLEPDWKDDAIRVWKIPVRKARSSSPPKRPHSSIDDADDGGGGGGGGSGGPAAEASSPPHRAALSDPDVAAMIIEKCMFNGKLKSGFFLQPRKVGELAPAQAALVKENGVLRLYRHGQDSLSPESNVFVFPGPDDKAAEDKRSGSLPINHHALPPTCYGQTSVSYVVKCHDRRGTFKPDEATRLGVTKRYYRDLIAGKSVQGADGKTVLPEMVMGAPKPGKGFVVADIPGPDYVDGFMERAEWKNAGLMENIVSFYWILGPGLSHDARIHAFIKQHGGARHVFCAQDTCPNMIVHPGAADLQVRLRQIDPERYPVARYDNSVRYPQPPPESPIVLGRAGEKMQLMPSVQMDGRGPTPFTDLAAAGQALTAEVLELAERAQARASNAGFLARIEEGESDIPNRDAEIVALGTGSASPSKYRNVSATLIRVPGIGNYLLDCGEGTLGQMRRAFGPDGAADVLRGLRCIVISHFHADHHMGTASVVKAWYEQALRDDDAAAAAAAAPKRRLAISCIDRYRQLLEEVAQAEDMGYHRLHFPHSGAGEGADRDLDTATASALGDGEFGLASVRRVAVPHCWRSQGAQLELTSGLRVAYSGDCRPSAELARAFAGAHLLVHECTFADDMAASAVAKRHSTMAEALAVARRMRARRTLLTHFSQRYVKAGSLAAAGPADRGAVLLAVDMMRVRLGDFQRAACFAPAVQAQLRTMVD